MDECKFLVIHMFSVQTVEIFDAMHNDGTCCKWSTEWSVQITSVADAEHRYIRYICEGLVEGNSSLMLGVFRSHFGLECGRNNAQVTADVSINIPRWHLIYYIVCFGFGCIGCAYWMVIYAVHYRFGTVWNLVSALLLLRRKLVSFSFCIPYCTFELKQ